jgi:hypothetical protein
MGRRFFAILGLLILAGLLAWVYITTRLPPGIQVKGGAPDWLPWVSLAGSVVSFLTALVTLTVELVKARAKRSEPEKGTWSRVRSR